MISRCVTCKTQILPPVSQQLKLGIPAKKIGRGVDLSLRPSGRHSQSGVELIGRLHKKNKLLKLSRQFLDLYSESGAGLYHVPFWVSRLSFTLIATTCRTNRQAQVHHSSQSSRVVHHQVVGSRQAARCSSLCNTPSQRRNLAVTA